MSKRRAAESDINRSPVKRIKLVMRVATEPPCLQQPSLAEFVLSTPELLENIQSNFNVNSKSKLDAEGRIEVSLTMRMLAFTSKSIYTACARSAESNYHEYHSVATLKDWAAKWGYFSCFKYLHECNPTTTNFVLTKDERIIRYCHENGLWISDTCHDMAAQDGDLKTIVLLSSLGVRPSTSTAVAAAKRGHVNVLKLLLSMQVRLNKKVIEEAASHGHLNCIKYLRQPNSNCPFEPLPLVLHAASSANLKCLKYCFKFYDPEDESTFNFKDSVIDLVISHKNSIENVVGCVDFLLSMGFKMNNPAIWNDACRAGMVPILQKYYEHNNTDTNNKNNCIDEYMVGYAAQGGLECLKFAHEKYGTMPRSVAGMIERGDVKTFEYFLDHCPDFTIQKNDYLGWLQANTVKLAYERGIEIPSSAYITAITWDDHECVKFLLDKKIPVPTDAASVAVMNGFKCLKILHNSGLVNWDCTENAWVTTNNTSCIKYGIEAGICRTTISRFTKENAKLDVIRFMHKRGIELDPRTCYLACWRGKIHILKYAHKRGLPIDRSCMLPAIDSKSLGCVKYLHENGIALDSKEFTEAAVLARDKPIFEYLVNNNCPYDAHECVELVLQRDVDRNKPQPTVEYLKSLLK